MGLVQSLSIVALRQAALGATKALGVVGVDAAFRFLSEHFTDNSRRLVAALQGASSKAWNSVEIALAGGSLWQTHLDHSDAERKPGTASHS